MRSWHIIAASTLAATAAGILLVVLGGLPWRSGIAALVIAHWPVIALVWLSTYGLVAPVLTTLAALLGGGGVTRRRAWDDRVRRYLVQLAATQFYTSLLGLLALGLSRIPVETTLFPALPSPIGDSPALAACGVVAVIGLLGGLLTAAGVTGESPETEAAAPGVRASRLFGDVSEPPLAPETANAAAVTVQPPPAPVPANAVADVEQLVELIEKAQRPVLEAVRELAVSVNRLRRGLGEIKYVLQDRESGRSTKPDSGSPAAAEDAAAQLRAVVAAVDASVARLGEMALLLSANEPPVVTGREEPGSPDPRSRLSAELQALLRDLTTAGGNDDPHR